MDNNIEVLISDIIFVFLKQKGKTEWNTLLEIILKNEDDKIIPFTLNNYAKLTFEEDSEKIEYMDQVIKCILNQDFIAKKLIKEKVLNIYTLNKKNKQKIKF